MCSSKSVIHRGARLAVLLALLGVTLATSPIRAQQAACQYYQVKARSVNVFSQPRGDASFVGMANKNDFVCVIGEQNVSGDRVWAHITYKLTSQNQRTVMEGWAIEDALQPTTQAQVTALSNATSPPPATPAPVPPPVPPSAPSAQPAPNASNAPPAPAAAPPAASSAQSPASGQSVVTFTGTITEGPTPINGSSLAKLITSTPIYPPVEGLPDEVWKNKTCNSCHQWNQQSLCVQAKLYVNNPKMALRIQHPFGGPEKVAMIKWAQGGCQ